MRKVKFVIIALMVGLFSGTAFLVSCQKEGVSPSDSYSGSSTTFDNARKKFHIYYATWEKWGKTKRDCKGFGLCNFEHCFFCCTENGEIVDCNSKKKIIRGGIVLIEPSTNEGYMIVKLDTIEPIQKEALQQNLPLVLDSDIVGDYFVLKKGVYPIDASVGELGGYKVKVVIK